MAMAKPSSNPVRKTATRTNRPIIPIVISPIFSPEDLHDITEEHKGLEKQQILFHREPGRKEYGGWA
jgi:hypothetical protein